MRVSIVGCGQRRLTLVTAGGPVLDRLHRAMLASIVCRPDPKLETAAIREIPLRIELPGWKAVDRAEGQLMLSDGRSYLLFRPGLVSSREQFNEVIGATFGAMMPDMKVTPAGAEAVAVAGTMDGERVVGWARQLRCGPGLLVLLLAPDGATARRIGAIADRARCTRPGERGQEWPDAPKAE
jgi:hypothetical protein